jgi:pyruvate dehydrogenase E2 component (dihydrolipoamide acetyltransferase)
MALAMAAAPDVNVQFGSEVLHRFARVDIAMAVAIICRMLLRQIKDT